MSDTDTDTRAPGPELTELNRPYWDALQAGRLTFQRCNGCGHGWLPARGECPNCLAGSWNWEQAAGGARLISWVVYHIAYHPSFAKRLPYIAAVVELDEGPRMISNIVGADASALKIDMALKLVVQTEGEFAVARFAPA
jgi:uncharacterized OB-fold protein